MPLLVGALLNHRESKTWSFLSCCSCHVSLCGLCLCFRMGGTRTVLLLGWELQKSRYIYLSAIKMGRQARLSIYRKWERPTFFNKQCSLCCVCVCVCVCVFFPQHYSQALSVWLFMIGQLLIAWPVIVIVLGKAAIFYHGLNGCKTDNMKWTLWGWGCFVGCFIFISPSLKKFQTSWLAKHCLVLLFRQPTSVYKSAVHAHTSSNMNAVSVCFRNAPHYDTDYMICNMLTQSLHAWVCTHTHACLYVFCKAEWLPFPWREQGIGASFFFIWEGCELPFIKS